MRGGSRGGRWQGTQRPERALAREDERFRGSTFVTRRESILAVGCVLWCPAGADVDRPATRPTENELELCSRSGTRVTRGHRECGDLQGARSAARILPVARFRGEHVMNLARSSNTLLGASQRVEGRSFGVGGAGCLSWMLVRGRRDGSSRCIRVRARVAVASCRRIDVSGRMWRVGVLLIRSGLRVRRGVVQGRPCAGIALPMG